MIIRNTPIQLDLAGTQFQDYKKDKLLFFDIETTGLNARTSWLYLIGTVTWRDGGWICTQWFAEDTWEESQILQKFLDFSKSYTQYIHFNGDRFDIPFLNTKCETYHLQSSLTSIVSRDLYRMIRPLKKLLSLSALNQRSLEEFLGIFRKDPFNGGELIDVYTAYIREPTEDRLNCLLLHNYEDLQGMLSILPILSYQNILNGTWQVIGCERQGEHVLLTLRLPLDLPKPFTSSLSLCTLHGKNNVLQIDVPGFQGILKYFFADYKNYYYLPEEDMALHKSIAKFVDPGHRIPAKASNCYNKKQGFYLPQGETLFTPVFKTDYADPRKYFACGEPFLQDREKLYAYAQHLLTQW